MGVSVLLKGPIGPMVPLLAGITLAVADRRAPWLRALRPMWGVPLMAAAAAPWFIAVTLATEGRFLADALGGDMAGKVAGADENHWGPPGFYLGTFGIVAFPAAFLLLRAIPGIWADRLNPATRFLLAWAVPTWLVFEAVTTKLPHYTLPTFPALMLLAAAWAMDPLRRAPPRWLDGFARFVVTIVATGLALAAVALPWLADGAPSFPSLLALPFAAALVVLVWRHWAAPARAGLLAVALAVPLQAVILEGVLPRLEAPWVSPRVAAAARTAAPGLPDHAFGIAGYHEPSLQFALGGGIALLRDGAAAVDFLAAAPGRIVAVEARHRAAFDARAATLALTPRDHGLVTGFNYSRGRRVAIAVLGAGG
jgi:4-amino-4-deoxy-L-arabinose transferase-like glycosyltransferase